MFAEIRVILCLSVKLNIQQASLERNEKMYHLDYTDKLLQCCYPNARQPSYQINGKPFYAASWQLPEAPARK